MEINLEFIHNHSINTADALRYRPISDECKKKFLELFAEDHTPSSALAQHKKDLRCEISDDDFMSVMADRSIVPDYFWAFHFHKKYVENTFGSVNGPDAFKQAKERIAKYNEKHQIEVAKMEETAGEIIAAICDPFCRRVHENLPQAGDIVLVDATSNLDRHDTKLFHMVCPSPADGLPLGNILTSSAAISLYKSLLPRGADRLNLDISEISSNNDESDNDIDRSDFIRTFKESMSYFTQEVVKRLDEDFEEYEK